MGTSAEIEELGAVEIKPPRPMAKISLGFDDYTTERREIFKNLTPEDVRKGVEEMRGQG